MKYLEVKSTDPYLNLALENYIFEYMEPKEDCFYYGKLTTLY